MVVRLSVRPVGARMIFRSLPRVPIGTLRFHRMPRWGEDSAPQPGVAGCSPHASRSLSSHSKFELLVAVHTKHADSGSSDHGLADDVDSFPTEVIVPELLARVEERCKRVGNGIDSGKIRSLVEIAIDAGQAEVRLIIGTAVFERSDMLDVQGGEWRIFLMGLAIFAAVSCTLPDKGSRCGGHAELPALNFLASRRSTATNLLALT